METSVMPPSPWMATSSSRSSKWILPGILALVFLFLIFILLAVIALVHKPAPKGALAIEDQRAVLVTPQAPAQVSPPDKVVAETRPVAEPEGASETKNSATEGMAAPAVENASEPVPVAQPATEKAPSLKRKARAHSKMKIKSKRTASARRLHASKSHAGKAKKSPARLASLKTKKASKGGKKSRSYDPVDEILGAASRR